MRGLEWLRSGVLPRSEARHWGLWVPLAKLLFLTAYAALLAAFLRSRGRWTLPEATLLVFLAFQVLYGAVSAQYLLWVVPLAALDPDRLFAWHSLSATAALLGFYAFLQPVLLQAQPPLIRYSPQAAGLLWVAGVAALLASGAVWLAVRLRRRSAQG